MVTQLDRYLFGNKLLTTMIFISFKLKIFHYFIITIGASMELQNTMHQRMVDWFAQTFIESYKAY